MALLLSVFHSFNEMIDASVPICYHFVFSPNRKSTFDIFNFLASQHRQLPDIGPYDDEEDEVLLKSTRSGFT